MQVRGWLSFSSKHFVKLGMGRWGEEDQEGHDPIRNPYLQGRPGCNLKGPLTKTYIFLLESSLRCRGLSLIT